MTCFERHNVLTTYTDFFGKWHKEIKENLTGQNNQEFEVLPVRLSNFEIIIDLFARKVFFRGVSNTTYLQLLTEWEVNT